MTITRRRPPRIVLAKPGLDGHDRGVKVVGMALRDAGAEVIYLGLHQDARRILSVAVAEDADVVGLSVLSGVHLAVSREVLAARQEADAQDIAVVIGGTIPPADVSRLRDLGIDDVLPVGTPIDEVVQRVLALVPEASAL